MAVARTMEALLPSLLNRLLDDDPVNQVPEPSARRGLDADGLRDAVLEDLRQLLNTIAWPESDNQSLRTMGRANPVRRDWVHYLAPQEYPEVAASVLNFGVPPAFDYWESSAGMQRMQRLVAKAIERYEPRITLKPNGVTVLGRQGVESRPNMLAIRIEGTLWAQPTPIELVLRSDLDVERREAHLRVLEEVR